MVRLYLTPRFLEGISKAELLAMDGAIQRETMLVWFWENYKVAEGRFYAVSVAQLGGFEPEHKPGSPKDYSMRPIRVKRPRHNPNLVVGADDQAPLFEGDYAQELLVEEFGDVIEAKRVREVAAVLPGLWMLRTDVALATGTQDALETALNRLIKALQQIPARPADRLHNHPPDAIEPDDDLAPLTVKEKDQTLLATASMRMAVLSADFRLAAEVWETIKPFIHRVGAAVARYTDLYFTQAASKMADLTVAAVPGVILACLHVVDVSTAIRISLSALAAISGKAKPKGS